MQEKWKQLVKNGKGTWLMIAVCAVAALGILLLPEKTNPPENITENESSITTEEYTEILSARIATMVSAITGESSPHVTVTLKSMGETIYATEDRQSERNSQEYTGSDINKTQTDGDTEKTYIIVKSADGSQKPLIVTKTEPQVQGVVIVSRLGNDIQTKEKITQAVKTALDLSSTQVCVTGYSEYT